jgi:hypothetical protein
MFDLLRIEAVLLKESQSVESFSSRNEYFQGKAHFHFISHLLHYGSVHLNCIDYKLLRLGLNLSFKEKVIRQT